MQAFTQHVEKGKQLRGEMEERFAQGKKEYKGKLDFTAYTLGHDPSYLGVNGKIVLGKPWGQDSSGIQAVLNSESYWKRLYYRPENALQKSISAAAGDSRGSKDTQNDEFTDGYGTIKDNVEEFVMNVGKPKTSRTHPAERLNFFNTPTKERYFMKGVVGSKATYNFEKKTHTSRPHELKYIASMYFRTDTDTI
eukprot:GEMP01068922.1.p1 GENE.GEMP01068922.1~~GEMP01068922.1.p1  ORF type:complete len:194 (+),score=32.93 GEMP01068922.1:87-668(+)